METRIVIRTVIIAIMLCIPLAPFAALAQDDKPTIAFLRYAGTGPVVATTEGMLDSLETYGYLTSAERDAVTEAFDLKGENINLISRDAGFDLATVSLMVEEALDSGVDALVTVTTQVAQIAVNATRGMDDPPAIIFSLVTAPYATGIADAPCVKPDHVTGSQPIIPFDEYVPLVQVQNPDIQTIGTITTPDQPTSIVGAEIIAELAEPLGLTLEVASAVNIADLSLAAESLLGKGVEAIVLTINPLTLQGTPALVQLTAEHGIPLYAPVIQQVYRGVTVAAGFHSFYEEGVVVARILNAHLRGEIDIADIGINQSRSFGLALNLDTAAAQEVTISDDLMAMANFVIENGERSAGMAADMADAGMSPQDMTAEERHAADMEFLAGLRCTDEMIAEQRARL